MEYAKDAMETAKPWEKWEFNNEDEWEPFRRGHPLWDKNIQYRRKEKTININGYEVPEPMKDRPSFGTIYYWVYFGSHQLVVKDEWVNCERDKIAFINNICHLTRDAAVKHAKALLSFSDI